MPETLDAAHIASELRLVLRQLVHRLRAERSFPLAHAAVLGWIDRTGPQSVSDLAFREHLRPQSMAQTVADLETLGQVARHPDPDDRRRALVELTVAGREALERDREQREGWLAGVIAERLSEDEQHVLREAVTLLQRLVED